MGSKPPVINLRYRSVAQLNLIKRAAKLKDWSLNTFVLNAAEETAKAVVRLKQHHSRVGFAGSNLVTGGSDEEEHGQT
jgi:uncharacterized protein (DUF1778 family)